MLVEKYRPKTFDDIVGQDDIVAKLRSLASNFRESPHMLFSGPPGSGKTSTAYVFAREASVSLLEFNASDERGINVVREKIKKLAFSLGSRVILLDEADRMTDEAQHALRRIIERANPEVKFIIACNEEWRIIDPIKSRCAIFRFRKLPEETVIKILAKVLLSERKDLTLTKEVKDFILSLVKFSDGDLRKAMNNLETVLVSRVDVSTFDVNLLSPISVSHEILSDVNNGGWREAFAKIDSIFTGNRVSPEIFVDSMFKTLKAMSIPEEKKLSLFSKLTDVERNLKLGCNPVIQLSGFIAYAALLLSHESVKEAVRP